MTVIWAKKAYDDLDAIADYLAGLSHEAADTTITRVQEAVRMLGDFPHMGAKVDESGLRRLVISGTPYVIFYRVLSDQVCIRGVFHSRQRRFLE